MWNYRYPPGYTGYKIIVICKYCLSKMRVPVDKGKIAVICPECRKEFIYNPDSIFHTVKQIFLLAASKLPGKRKKLLLMAIIAVFAVLAVLYLVFAGKPGLKPLPKVKDPSGPFI